MLLIFMLLLHEQDREHRRGPCQEHDRQMKVTRTKARIFKINF